ncbi:D-glycero-alpha-D-manno-heptose-1,7-bisphosphate 7-phosphatase [Bacillus suaedaesalsae]|uniref:D,D-heptose 1,7-bisphosphate phosphatase n=1 Tax=Bacillus suaedaesalsae TaxID=2810349 RepID=A0ABS2DH37_9BACI|nr:HAD-IIIA family hydrolase [Bacillus suaedaesalsae]MBM6617795.1 HAD-IIIA family hydrolase [Bacillus suaedaesalsae]
MKAVFLDRDGTIGGTGGGVHPFEFLMYEFSARSIRQLNELGIKVFLFTNQTRVGRGYFTEEELLQGFEMMKDELAKHAAYLDDIFYCPHKPEDGCECQKPNIGLLLKAQEKYNLNLSKCYVVGDTGSSDMIAANLAGTKKVLVKTGWGEHSLTTHRDKWKDVEPDHIAVDLVEAVKWITNDLHRLAE